VGLFAIGLVVAFLLWIAERKERREVFAPAPCRYCEMTVIHRNGRWLHSNGEAWMPFPELKGVPGILPPKHPASPNSQWWSSHARS
jgi:hypothetical protein